ncbi:MAG: FMN-binding protein [Sandaracinaceae bacterium]|nr:FMN-binding protein [Sandaracinaceae bacterium]
MKTVFKFLCALTLTVAVALPVLPQNVRAQIYFSVRELLSTQFRASQRVSFVRVRPTAEQRTRIEARLGHPLTRDEYIVYIAATGGHVDGYAVFDAERGQHELIDFASFFDAQGHVTGVEVVQYREPYGDAVRTARFREQFRGRTAQSGFRPGHDIDIISGATISSRSLCVGVQRTAVLIDELAVRTSLAPTASR